MSVAVSSIEVACFRFAMISVFFVSDFSGCGCNNTKSQIDLARWLERKLENHILCHVIRP